MDDSSDELGLVELLAEEFLDRCKRGETPTIKSYCENHPELADEIQEVFEALMMLEDLKPAANDVTGPFDTERQFKGKQLDRVGDYRIIREVGRGGMGVVYEAEQESLHRRVALKVLPRQQVGDDKSLKRFQREARAAARMHHTNIVPVFEVGEDEHWAFYAMQLIRGQGLDLVIDDLKRIRSEHSLHKETPADENSQIGQPNAQSIAASLIVGRFEQENLADGDEIECGDSGNASVGEPVPSESNNIQEYAETILQSNGSTTSAVLPGQSELSSAETDRSGYFQSVAQIGLQTSRALAYAHARGIIHRDIKPSNLLLDAAGVVWVTDFGLAKTNDESMTHTGDILGTIRYMSPERFRGACDVRADVYSLRLTLYELLVLRPAFASPDRLRLIEMVSKLEPESPRSIDPEIPLDLETIILKCIDKDPKHRYQSADELADDLDRFVKDEPILARRLSWSEHFARWGRRNKALATSISTIAILLMVVAVGSTIAAGYFRQQGRVQHQLATKNKKLANEKDNERKVAVDARQEAVRQRKRTEEALAEVETQKQRAIKAKEAADALRITAEQRRDDALRVTYYATANNAVRQSRGDRCGPPVAATVHQSRLSPMKTDPRKWEWHLLNAPFLSPALRLHGHRVGVRDLKFDSDGDYLLSLGFNDAVRIWHLPTGHEVSQFRVPVGILADWSPDRRFVVVGTAMGFKEERHEDRIFIFDTTEPIPFDD